MVTDQQVRQAIRHLSVMVEGARNANQAGEDAAVMADAAPVLASALEQLLGTPADPKIGWRDTRASNNDLYKCEFCWIENLDFRLIEHQADCPVRMGFEALAKARGDILPPPPEPTP